MPYTQSAGARIYWESRGEGPPVLFIMGMAFSHEMWFRVVEWVAPRFRAILFDNRGSGRSDTPRQLYTIPQMAADAVAVMRAAGVDSAHVLGASMGGMIAQELVLRWPERVRSLTLGCTHAGWLWSKLPHAVVFKRAWKLRGLSPEKALELLDQHMYHPSTPNHLVAEDRAVRLANLPPSHGYRNQILAVATWWGSYRRLPSIRKPVVILHGEDDPLIPVENGRILQRRIPGARLEVVRQCRHVMPTDQPGRTSELVMGFLDEQAACA